MRFRVMLFGCIAPLSIAVVLVWPYLLAVSFIARGVALGGWIERSARTITPDTVEQPVTVPTRYGPIKARLYRSVASPTRAALLVGRPLDWDLLPRTTH